MPITREGFVTPDRQRQRFSPSRSARVNTQRLRDIQPVPSVGAGIAQGISSITPSLIGAATTLRGQDLQNEQARLTREQNQPLVDARTAANQSIAEANQVQTRRIDAEVTRANIEFATHAVGSSKYSPEAQASLSEWLGVRAANQPIGVTTDNIEEFLLDMREVTKEMGNRVRQQGLQSSLPWWQDQVDVIAKKYPHFPARHQLDMRLQEQSIAQNFGAHMKVLTDIFEDPQKRLEFLMDKDRLVPQYMLLKRINMMSRIQGNLPSENQLALEHAMHSAMQTDRTRLPANLQGEYDGLLAEKIRETHVLTEGHATVRNMRSMDKMTGVDIIEQFSDLAAKSDRLKLADEELGLAVLDKKSVNRLNRAHANKRRVVNDLLRQAGLGPTEGQTITRELNTRKQVLKELEASMEERISRSVATNQDTEFPRRQLELVKLGKKMVRAVESMIENPSTVELDGVIRDIREYQTAYNTMRESTGVSLNRLKTINKRLNEFNAISLGGRSPQDIRAGVGAVETAVKTAASMSGLAVFDETTGRINMEALIGAAPIKQDEMVLQLRNQLPIFGSSPEGQTVQNMITSAENTIAREKVEKAQFREASDALPPPTQQLQKKDGTPFTDREGKPVKIEDIARDDRGATFTDDATGIQYRVLLDPSTGKPAIETEVGGRTVRWHLMGKGDKRVWK